MNTDTPETDAMWSGDDWGEAFDAKVQLFCRRIERERNQARQERDELREALVAMVCCAESKIEPIESLYQAREILEKLKEPKSEGVS